MGGTNFGARLLFAALLATGGAFAADAVVYELMAGSTILDACRDCDRIPIERPLAGTFALTQAAAAGSYDVTDIDFASPAGDYQVTGKGTYYQNFLAKPVQEMGLDLAVNDVAGVKLASGTVGIGEEWPVIDISVTEDGLRDPVHMYTVRVRAAPRPKAWIRYQLTEGEGDKGSYFIDECLPCAGPTVLIPIRGSFMLGEIEGPNPFVTYRVEGLDVHPIEDPGAYQITGGGVYRQGGEVALTQEALLILQINTEITTETGAILFADREQVPAAFPEIDVTLKHKNPPSDFHVYTLRILAKPSASEQTFRRGEANADGDRNIADAIYTLAYLFAQGPDPTCMDAADGNDDGQVNIADAVALLGHLFGGTGPLAAPFATCGVDPTADSLGCASFPPCP